MPQPTLAHEATEAKRSDQQTQSHRAAQVPGEDVFPLCLLQNSPGPIHVSDVSPELGRTYLLQRSHPASWHSCPQHPRPAGGKRPAHMRLRLATAPRGSLPALDEGDGQKQQVFGRGPQNQRPQDLCSVGGSRHPLPQPWENVLEESSGLWACRGCPQTTRGITDPRQPSVRFRHCDQDPGPHGRNLSHRTQE